MREPELAAELVEAVRKVVPASIPVTVKHRLGWDDASLNAPAFARRLVAAGAALVTVHGRTRSQGFSGQARLEPIAAVRAELPREIPVIGNGDVKTVADYVRMKDATGVDGVMIGRGSMGNPWLFRSLRALAAGEPDPGPPTIEERRSVWRRHAELVLQHSPEKMRLHELRKTVAWYSRGLFGGAQLRQACFEQDTPDDLFALGNRFFDGIAERASGPDGLAQVTTSPADPVAKSIARKERRGGDRVEADEGCAA
jgi:nifR3 family TIM-barrel protein